MPIRPENKARYPKDWKAISHRIRFERADFQCECEGECGRMTHDGRCTNRHGQKAYSTGSIVVLTTAHLNHIPEDCRDENLRAMCQGCHLHYDRAHHAETAAATRRAALEDAMPPFVRGDIVSTPTATEVFAEHGLKWNQGDEGRCLCGYWLDASDDPGQERVRRMHASHQLSKLSEQGYSIVELPKSLTDHTGDQYWPFESLGPIVNQKVVLRDGRAFLSSSSIIRTPDMMRGFAAALLAAAAAAEEEKP